MTDEEKVERAYVIGSLAILAVLTIFVGVHKVYGIPCWGTIPAIAVLQVWPLACRIRYGSMNFWAVPFDNLADAAENKSPLVVPALLIMASQCIGLAFFGLGETLYEARGND